MRAVKYIAAYLLAVLAGNQPNAKSVKAILTAAGASVDDEALNKVISELDGKNVEEVIAAGKTKMASLPVGGGAAPAAAAAAPAAGGAGGKGAEKKEEKKKEPEPEDDADMGFGLFD